MQICSAITYRFPYSQISSGLLFSVLFCLPSVSFHSLDFPSNLVRIIKQYFVVGHVNEYMQKLDKAVPNSIDRFLRNFYSTFVEPILSAKLDLLVMANSQSMNDTTVVD